MRRKGRGKAVLDWKGKPNVIPFTIGALIFITMYLQGGFFSSVRIFLCICITLIIVFILKRVTLDLTGILLLALAFLTILSSVAAANDSYTAMLETLKYILLFLSFVMFSQLGGKELESVQKAFYGSFLLLGIFGFLAWGGALNFADALTAGDRRVQSFLQYANTTGFCMSACFLMSLDYLRKSRKIRYGFASAFSILMLALTQSRTAMVLLAAVVLLYGFIRAVQYMKRDRRALYIVCACAVLLSVSVIFFGRAYILNFLQTGTFIERLITFQDAIGVLLHFPLFGLGTGGWQNGQFIYQSGPYAVRYIHNFYLQAALDAGIPAFIIFVVLTALMVIKAFKRTDNVIAWVFILLSAGNLLEFHMNFGIILLLFAFCLASLCQGRRLFSINLSNKLWKTAVCVAIVAPLGVLWASEYQLAHGERLIDQKQTSRAITYFKWSSMLDPLNYQAVFNISKCEPNFDISMRYALKAYRMNPNDIEIAASLADKYALKGDWENAVYFNEELFRLNPRNVDYQDALSNTYASALDAKVITTQEYEEKAAALSEELEKIENSQNKLYRLIQAESS